MSLLTRRAPHTVLVQNRSMTRDTGGRQVWVPDGPLIPVKCAVQVARDWSSAEEYHDAGLQVLDMRVVLARYWPGNENSHVTWSSELWEMVGAPGELNMSRRTRHWRVTMRRVATA